MKTSNLLLRLISGVLMGLVLGCVTASRVTPTPRPRPTIDELIELFASADDLERVEAASQAGFYKNHPDAERLVPYLVAALTDPESRVCIFAAQSIRQLGIYDAEAIEILISWLDGYAPSSDAQIQAIGTLAVFAEQSSGAVPGLIRILLQEPPWSQGRSVATHALAAIGDPVAVPYLLALSLSSSEEWLRKQTNLALAAYGPEAACAVPYLVPLLEAPEVDVRLSAAIAINEASGNTFPDAQSGNWAPSTGVWQFEQNAAGEYLLVSAAQAWWAESGQHTPWPVCPAGLEGEPVTLPQIP